MKPKRIEECGCCEVGIPPTPEEIKNRPGLSAIAYRVGTYASFRQAMIEAIVKSPELADWTARGSDDYGIALMEMWAYLADILTFYQERIANEAFIRTALHRDTIMRLASMLDYKLNPGVAATTWLTFFAEKGAKVNIPSGLRVQSVPGQDEMPQKFETTEAIEAFSGLNELHLQQTKTQYVLRGDRDLVLKGINTGLKAGDYILIVGKHHRENPGSERWDLRKLSSVTTDSKTQTTTVKWDERLGHRREGFPSKEENKDLEIFALKLTAWPFGVNAPDYKLAPTRLDANSNPVPIFDDWTGKTLPEDKNNPNHIFLDNIYDPIKPDSWIVLLMAESPKREPEYYPGYSEAYLVESVDKTVYTNYTLSSKVTRLTVYGNKNDKGLIEPEHIRYFPMKGTTILAQSEPLEKADIPIDEPIKGSLLNFDRHLPELKAGRYLLLKGELSDSSGEERVETVQVKSVEHNDDLTKTSVTLKNDLQNPYIRKTVIVCGNVAEATHGETVSGEILGSGDASMEFQSFTLKKSPTTFIPASNAPRGAENTLRVRIGGVLWKEVESLYGQGAKDRVYITWVNDDDKMDVQFGDGKTGAYLPTGQDNVVAKYRQGLGSDGNVCANTLKTLLDRPVGLKSAANPKKAEGGTNPESLQEARVNAPNTVRTFERAISLRDYEDLARSYTGIAKAKAIPKFSNENEIIQLTIAGENGERIEKTSQTYENFIDYLDLHRDINRLLDVVPHSNRSLVLNATVQVDSTYMEEVVLSTARATLLNYFDFNNLQLGQGIHLSDIYSLLQEVEGVRAVRIECLDYKEKEPSSSPSLELHLRIDPDQIATLEADDLKITSDLT